MNGNTRLIGAALVALVVFSGAGYLYQRNRLDDAVSELDISFDKVKVKSVRILPSPEANLTLTYVANNTKNIQFRITMGGELYYGSHYVTPLTISDTLIRAEGLSTFQVDVSITGSILNIIDPENKNKYIVQGELVASSRFLGTVPVSITKPLSEYQPGQG